MANPTAAASTNKTGKPRKKTELPRPQVIGEQAKPEQAKPNQGKPNSANPKQANPNQANLSQAGPGQVFGQTRKTTTKSSSNDLGQKPGRNEATGFTGKITSKKASKPKAASAFGSVSDKTFAFNNEKGTLVLTNCTDSPRGIAFKNGMLPVIP